MTRGWPVVRNARVDALDPEGDWSIEDFVAAVVDPEAPRTVVGWSSKLGDYRDAVVHRG